MQFSVNMLTTRSGTDGAGDTNSDATADYEVGKDRENTISKVDIVLTNDEGAYVVAANVTPSAAATDTYVASFSKLELEGGKTYYAYIYANCEAPKVKVDATNGVSHVDAVSSSAINDITADNSFWMTNAYETSDNPVILPEDLSLYTQPQNPLNLGSHYVERVMARFDYKPINENKYNILSGETVNATIELTEAALINQSKSFYMFRRVSAAGDNVDWTVGGTETPYNYVVDTDYAAKANGYDASLVENFDCHLTTPNNWVFKSIAVDDLTEADNWNASDDGTTGVDPEPTHSLNDYYIWQYAKENTIPGVDNQDHGISTGVVFKGQITGAVVTAANGDMIFVFENVLYGNWDAVLSAANAEDAPATLVAAVNKINAIKDNPETDEVEKPVASDYANAGFTGYNPDEDGNYYAYYYYWNRHNDNGDNAKMGVMEFAVVRNNVYKLCVDKIAKFGHPDPTDPENPDPEPVDPEDPDEELNYYFTVTVKVLPWVVRVNHIEF